MDCVLFETIPASIVRAAFDDCKSVGTAECKLVSSGLDFFDQENYKKSKRGLKSVVAKQTFREYTLCTHWSEKAK